MTRVLFVCLGNICRSPAAEGVFEKLVRDAKLEGEIEIDSCGTASYHEGELADARMRAAAQRRGYDLRSVARGLRDDDLQRFDRILAMDTQNLRALEARAKPVNRKKLALLRDYDDQGRGDVPDPYYGGPEGFDEVLDIVLRCGKNLLREIVRDKGLPSSRVPR